MVLGDWSPLLHITWARYQSKLQPKKPTERIGNPYSACLSDPKVPVRVFKLACENNREYMVCKPWKPSFPLGSHPGRSL